MRVAKDMASELLKDSTLSPRSREIALHLEDRLSKLDVVVGNLINIHNKLMADSQPFLWKNMPSQGRFLIRESDKYEKVITRGYTNDRTYERGASEN